MVKLESVSVASCYLYNHCGELIEIYKGQELRTFSYNEQPVRVLLINEIPWWVLGDVCKILQLGAPHSVVKRLGRYAKRVVNFNHQRTIIVGTADLYKLIRRKNNQDSREFERWLDSGALVDLYRV